MMSESGIVLALGSGGARGVAHIGVLQALQEEGIAVRAVTGSSIGAEIGALFATGMPLEEIRRMAVDVDWKTTLRLFMPELGNGGILTDKGIRQFLAPYLSERKIEDLSVGFASVAADLLHGGEMVFEQGDLMQAVRASISIPGLLAPVRLGDHWLVDGGLVNPVPFDVARRLFGGPVVAVAVHPGVHDLEIERKMGDDWQGRLEELIKTSLASRWPQLQQWLDALKSNESTDETELGLGDVYNRAMDVSRAQLMRLRQQLMPPDVLIEPDVRDIAMLEFYRGDMALKAGYEATRAAMPEIRACLQDADHQGLQAQGQGQ